MVRAVAHTNIALVKYWGKHPAWEELHVPTKSSISLTVRDFYTETNVEIRPGSGRVRRFVLNNKEIAPDSKKWKKIQKFIDKLRTYVSNDFSRYDYEIVTKNNFPTAAGFASSASGFAALAKAILSALSEEHSWAEEILRDTKKVSVVARLGSGSASRSVDGGVRVWWRGWDKKDFDPLWDSYSEKYTEAPEDIVLLYVPVEVREKKVGSREGMQQSVYTSPFYWQWVEVEEGLLWKVMRLLEKGRWEKLFPMIIKFSNNLHAICRSTYPPIEYLNNDSFVIMERVVDFNREYGPAVAYTFDAGPNPVLFTTTDLLNSVKKEVLKGFNFWVTKPL